MRILHAMECTIGGARRHLVDVASGQLARGHEVALAVACEREPRFRKDLDVLQQAGATLFEIPMLRQIAPWRDARQMFEIRRCLREYSPEIVHTHSSKAGVLGRVASLLEHSGVRVHTPHTFAFLFSAEFGPLRRALFRKVETALAKRSACIVAVSEGEAETFRACGVVAKQRIRVVRNGIDPAPWLAARPLDRAAFGLPADAPLILVAGLLHIAKGQDLAIEALTRPGLERAHLALLGDGTLRASLEAQVQRLGLQSRVHLPGWSESMPGWMAAADVVLVPSRWEAMPYIVLEAMACARPLVATRVDGAREMIVDGEHGVLCDIGSVDSIADGLRRALGLDAKRRAELGARARERLLGMGTAERMVDELLALYTQLR